MEQSNLGTFDGGGDEGDAEGEEVGVLKVNYTVETGDDGPYPVVHVFGRTREGEPRHVRVTGFRPYFYAPTDEVDDEEDERITGTETGYESIEGDDLTRLYARIPPDVGEVREPYTDYEADILFPDRFRIDKDVKSGMRLDEDGETVEIDADDVVPCDADTPARTCVLDIEVDDRNGFPEDGEEPVICLTAWDSFDDEYHVFVWNVDEDDVDADGYVLHSYDEEEVMLDGFLGYLNDRDPDVMTGWNCLPGDTEVSMADGSRKEIHDVEEGDTVFGEEDGETTVAEVSNRWVSEKRVYEFELADSGTLRASGEHRVMVGDEDSVGWKRGEEIEEGDYVLKPRSLNVEETHVPTLSELVPDHRQKQAKPDGVRSFKQGLPPGTVSGLAGEFGVSKETLYHPCPTVCDKERMRRAERRYGVAVPDGGWRYKGTERELDRELTEDEVYLAGLVMTDGTMSEEDGVRFYNTRKELHDAFPGDNSLRPDGKGCYAQSVLDYARMRAFGGLGVPFGDKNEADINLSAVFQMPQEYVARFLAGVIDGDGCVTSDVTVSAANPSARDWYARLFRRVGVYAEECGDVVRIPDSERELDVLKEKVLPHMRHTEKKERLEGVEGGKSGRTEDVPSALFEAETGSYERRVGRDRHRRGVSLKRHDTSADDWEGFVFVEVEEVNEAGVEATYDIETTTSNFFAEDCLVHNCNDFDFPYIIDRLDELGMDADRLARVGNVWHDDWGGPTVKGRATFDLLYAYQRMNFTELESYRLDAIAEEELGESKVTYTGKIGDLWEEDPDRLLEYNKMDVELCVRIDDKVGVIDFFRELARFVGCSLEDATTPSDVVDIYVLRKAHGKFVLPSKRGGGGGEEYEGGEVFEPITGIRENVAVLDLACFSGDTEVVTPDGVTNIKTVSVGDEVYTLNPDTFEVEVDEVAETHEYGNEYGELHHVSGNTHDLKVTENHRFLVSNKRRWDSQTPDDFEFIEYRDVPGTDRFAFPNHEPMDGEGQGTFEFWREVDQGYAVVYADRDLRSVRHDLPDAVCDEMELAHGSSGSLKLEKTGKYLVPIEAYRRRHEAVEDVADDVVLKAGRQHRATPTSFGMDDWLRLVGWYVTEGSVYDGGTGDHKITIHQQGDERDEIRDLLERMDLNYSTDARGINLSNRLLLNWLVENCGAGSGEKRLPEFVFRLDASHLKVLLETLVKGDVRQTKSDEPARSTASGDGTPSERTGNVDKFWTKSDALKDGIIRLGVRCGEKPTVKKQDDGTWYVSFGKRGSFNKSVNASVEDHEGSVYCLTAEDNHVVLAGRGGKFQWVGQSLYPMSMISVNASPETKVSEGYDGETYEVGMPDGDEVRFRKEPEGLTKSIVTELLEERDKKKAARDEHDMGSEKYEKYDDQQNAIKVVMNCFDGETEVIGEDGVKDIDEVEVGESLYTIDPDTQEVETKRVVETQEYAYDGEMVDIETRYVDFSVTPNHRMLVETDGETRFVEAGELNDYTGYQIPDGKSIEGRKPETFSLLEEGDAETAYLYTDGRGAGYKKAVGDAGDALEYDSNRKAYRSSPGYVSENPVVADEADEVLVQHGAKHSSVPAEYDIRDWLRLVGWYVAEGSVYEIEPKGYEDTKRGRSKKVQLGQLDEEGRERIVSLLERMGLNPLEEARQISFCNAVIADWLVENCGAGSEEKRLPGFVFELDASLLEHLFDALIRGDGDTYSGIRYSTKSDDLKDGVVRLAVHLGYKPLVNRDSGVWRVRFSDNEGAFRMHRNGGMSENDGRVYCVTVEDNHTVLAGRNGSFQWVGQSYYGVAGYPRFRLYDREMGSAVTATGRAVIEHTRDMVEDEGYEVVYGDSVTGERPVVLRDSDGRVRVLPIREAFEKAKTAKRRVTADGGKEYRALEGWEALSVNDEAEAEWKSVKGVMRHPTEKDVVRLQHKFGESVTTRDHSYIVEKDGELTESEPENVDAPLRVPSIPEVETVEEVDVYEVLRGYERDYVDRRGGATKEKTKRVRTDGEYVWFSHEGDGGRDSTIKVQRKVEVGSEEFRGLLRLLARFVADGSSSTEETSAEKFGASIASGNGEKLDRLKRDYDRLFENAVVSVTASDSGDERTVAYGTQDGETSVSYNDTTKKLQMMNELSAVFFREFAGQRSHRKRVPGFVYHLPREEQNVFLNALVRGDGSREFPRYSSGYAERNFDFETTSRELAGGLSVLLTQRGKKHSLKYREEKESYTVRTCDYYREGRAPVVEESEHDGYVYDISVADNQNFVDAVGGIVLHNTDSTLVELGDGSPDELVERGEALESVVNESYDSFALESFNAETHMWEIEFEKLYERFFQAGRKKRYAGKLVWKDGKALGTPDLDITGFEYKRSDVAPVTKEVQQEVIEMILDGAGFDEVSRYVRDVVDRFKDGDYGYDDMGIPGGIGQKLDSYDTDTAQVTGAKYANRNLGTNFTSGSKPKRLYIKRVKGDYPPTDVVCFEYPEQVPEEFEVDRDKMLEKTVRNPIERILEALGWSWSEVVNGQRQQGLGSFT